MSELLRMLSILRPSLSDFDQRCRHHGDTWKRRGARHALFAPHFLLDVSANLLL
jgi:hypothetical protein